MASLKDAVEESLVDNYSFFKYLIFTIPLFASYIFFEKGDMQTFYILGGITLVLFAGLLVQCIYNVRNVHNIVLPTANIFQFLVTIIKTIIAIGPVWALMIFGGIKLSEIAIPIDLPNIQIIYEIIVWFFFGSIMLTSLSLFAKNMKILEAYDVRLIAKSCVDMLVLAIFFIPQILLLNAIVLGVIAYAYSVFWDLKSLPFAFICCLAAVINLVVTAHYIAQMDYEVIHRKEDDEPDEREEYF